MSEITGEATQPVIKQETGGRLRGNIYRVIGGSAAVLAAMSMAAFKPAEVSDAIQQPSLAAQTFPRTSAFDLDSEIDGLDQSHFGIEATPKVPKLTDQPDIPSRLDPSKLIIPNSVSSYMKYNSLYLPIGPGYCSAGAIRNAANNIIGIMTAEHCGLNNADEASQEGSNGQFYDIWTAPIKVYRGENVEKLKYVAQITQFIVPDRLHTPYQDMVLGVAKGSTTKEVLRAYKSQALSPDQVEDIKPGTTIYMGGYPYYQPVNWTDNLQRQMFAMTALGTSTVRSIGAKGEGISGEPKRVKVLETATNTDKQGAVCSYGASGSEGFIIRDGHVKSVGVFSDFEQLKGPSVPENPINNIGVSKYLPRDRSSTVSAVCNFAYELGSKNDNTVSVVESNSQIPGFNEVIRLSSVNKLKDPKYPKFYLNGLIAINWDNKIKWVSNPIIFYDARTETTVIAFANSKKHGTKNLALLYEYSNDLGQINVYPHEVPGVVSLLPVKDALDFRHYASPHKPSGIFNDKGKSFGVSLRRPPTITGAPLKLEASKQGLSINEQNSL